MRTLAIRSHWTRAWWVPFGLGLALTPAGFAQSSRATLSVAGQVLSQAQTNPGVSLGHSGSMSENDLRAEVIRRLEERLERSKQRRVEPEPAPEPFRTEVVEPRPLPTPEQSLPPLESSVPRPRDTFLADSYEDQVAEVEGMRPSLPSPYAESSDSQGYMDADRYPDVDEYAPPEALEWSRRRSLEAGQSRPVAVDRPTERFPAPAPEVAPGPVQGPVRPLFHKLSRGETLWSLARKYDLTVQQLLDANGGTSPDHLPVGAVLNIPDPSHKEAPAAAPLQEQAPEPLPQPTRVAAPSAQALETYTVARGDTLYRIARQHQVTVDELIRANPDVSARYLAPGLTLVIPTPGAPSPVPATPQVPVAAATRVAVATPTAPTRPTPTAVEPQEEIRFEWPVEGHVVTPFGWKDGKPYTGIGIAAPEGTPIRAAAPGRVLFSGTMPGYGKVVVLEHPGKFWTVYGHNKVNLVQKIEGGAPRRVARGEVLAKVGATGDALSPQVRFEIRKQHQAMDPARYLSKRSAARVSQR